MKIRLDQSETKKDVVKAKESNQRTKQRAPQSTEIEMRKRREAAKKSQSASRPDQASAQRRKVSSSGEQAKRQNVPPKQQPAKNASNQSRKSVEPVKEPMGKKKKISFKVPIIIGAIVLVALIGFFGFRGFYNAMLQPIGGDSKTKIVEIPEGSTIKEVSQILYDDGLIKNTLIFESYSGRKSRGSSGMQAGNYELNKTMDVEQIVEKMITGDVYSGAIPIVIPEGRNINEMAQILEQHNICTAQNFIAESKKLAEYKAKFPILSSIPDNKNRGLEGYLFADTYEFETKTSAADVVSKMLTRFTEVYDQNFMQQTTEKGKTVDEIVIMASIIELETKLPEDKANASSVFYNRIAQGMNLQSDITVDYALGKKHAVLTEEQTKIDSPYNTYKYAGLPVGPICSPSKSSIEAALNPAQTKYIFFVADMSSGKLYFNETLEGHDADVRKYMGD